MELKFIWIKEKNKILKDFGINFNHAGEHRFHYLNNVLILTENKISAIDFGANIIGVTAIAGQNGSGKSSVCESVLNSTATLVNGSMGYNEPFDGIVCYGDHIFYNKNLNISNLEELLSKGYKVVEFDETPFEKMDYKWNESFAKGGFIYYSNIIDWRSGIQGVNLANISTQSMLDTDYGRTDFGHYDSFVKPIGDEFIYTDKISLPHAHYLAESYRNTKFYVNFSGRIPFSEPDQLVLKSTYSKNNRFLKRYAKREYDEIKHYDEFESNIFDIVQWKYLDYTRETIIKSDKQRFKQAKTFLYKLNLVISFFGKSEEVPDPEKVRIFIFENADASILFENFEIVNSLLALHHELVDSGDFIDEYKPESFKHSHENSADWRFYIIENAYINNTATSIKLLKNFIDLERKVLNDSNAFMIRISNYGMIPQRSAGENSFFSFFARLYDIIQRYDDGYDNRNTLALFIDEGEVGFHPAWKKKYLKWILDFLTDNFPKYKFQIILTTHSPYLLSDLPSENVVLLKLGENYLTEIVAPKFHNTFGANIHELLSDSFFLKDGTIGEFSRSKIQEVIDNLNKWKRLKKDDEKNFLEKNKIAQDKEITLNTISIIGDIIVRNKLFEMYYDIFEEDNAIDYEIDALSKRLENLKKRKKND